MKMGNCKRLSFILNHSQRNLLLLGIVILSMKATSDFPTYPHPLYPDQLCYKCPPGYAKVDDCKVDKDTDLPSWAKCTPCGKNEYMNDWNVRTSCKTHIQCEFTDVICGNTSSVSAAECTCESASIVHECDKCVMTVMESDYKWLVIAKDRTIMECEHTLSLLQKQINDGTANARQTGLSVGQSMAVVSVAILLFLLFCSLTMLMRSTYRRAPPVSGKFPWGTTPAKRMKSIGVEDRYVVRYENTDSGHVTSDFESVPFVDDRRECDWKDNETCGADVCEISTDHMQLKQRPDDTTMELDTAIKICERTVTRDAPAFVRRCLGISNTNTANKKPVDLIREAFKEWKRIYGQKATVQYFIQRLEESDFTAEQSCDEIKTRMGEDITKMAFKEGVKGDSIQDHENFAPAREETWLELPGKIFMSTTKMPTSYGGIFHGVMMSISGSTACVIKQQHLEQNIIESEILHKLGQHHNIISLVSTGTWQNHCLDEPYIVFERYHHFTLQDHIRLCLKTFENHQKLNFCRQVINGMKYIHSHLIIHKNLKPSNILLSDDLTTIKIAGFGSSQEVKSISSQVECAPGFGTLGYRPPESIVHAAKSCISQKSDIFPLGALFFYILNNGSSPFGTELDLFDHNTLNGVFNLELSTITNPATTKHLLELMLSEDRCRRPNIWEVDRHPCWTGEEVNCNFDYGYQAESLDSELEVPVLVEEKTKDEFLIQLETAFCYLDKQKKLKESCSKFGIKAMRRESPKKVVDGWQVPYDEITTDVGLHGKKFEIGGCTVYFPPRCFDKIQEVTVSAKVCPKERFPGKEAIAPCLDVKATNLKRKATVTFTSWCVPEDETDSIVDILHYFEEMGQWEVVHTCKLESSRSIKFKCRHFSRLIPVSSSRHKFVMCPRVYIFEQNFAVAVMLDQKLIRNHCLKTVKHNFGIGKLKGDSFTGTIRSLGKSNHGRKVRKFKMSVFTCKAGSTIESNLYCKSPDQGFTFGDCGHCEGGQCECGRFKHDVDDIIQTKKASITNLALQSKQYAAHVILKCLITREAATIRDDDIRHYWNPAECWEADVSSSRTESISECSNSRPSTKSPSNSTTDFDAFTGGQHATKLAFDSNELYNGSTNRWARPCSSQGTTNVINIDGRGLKSLNVSQGGAATQYPNLTAHTVNEGTANITKENVTEQILRHPDQVVHSETSRTNDHTS